MSITSALSGATSGLAASSRAAEVVSSNLSNMLTPGYAKRQLGLNTLGQGITGVGVSGIKRLSDPLVLSDRRLADAEIAFEDTRAAFFESMTRVIGTHDQPSSLPALVAAFEARLISASASPENTISLKAAIQSATDLTQMLNRAGKEIETQRTNADAAISGAVSEINTLLGQIRDVNARLGAQGKQDQHSATLLDQRDAMIDQLSKFIPVQSVAREGNTVALFTTGGAILLDGAPAELGFSGSPLVASHMTSENDLLSGLSINDLVIPASGPNSAIAGGRLAALFSVRDELAVSSLAQIDAMARDLIERFQQAGLDSTRPPGAPGLFTDNGASFQPADEVGLAVRIKVNMLLDSAQGGSEWRLRDGLGASLPGNPGNGSLIADLSDALRENRALASGAVGAPPRPASQHATAVSSQLAQDRLAADQARSFASARHAALSELEQQNGVDSDAELQKLMLIEQAYAANARMIQTIDEMIKALLRI